MTDAEKLEIDEALECLGMLYDAYHEAFRRHKDAGDDEPITHASVEAIKGDVNHHRNRVMRIGLKYDKLYGAPKLLGAERRDKNSIEFIFEECILDRCYQIADALNVARRSLRWATINIDRGFPPTHPSKLRHPNNIKHE